MLEDKEFAPEDYSGASCVFDMILVIERAAAAAGIAQAGQIDTQTSYRNFFLGFQEFLEFLSSSCAVVTTIPFLAYIPYTATISGK